MHNSDQSEEIAIADMTDEPVSVETIENQTRSGPAVTGKQFMHFPGRFAAFFYQNKGHNLKIGLMVLVFITALYTKSYTGDYQMLINNHIGGIFYVLFGSLAFSALFPRIKMIYPVLLATTATCILEFVQWLRLPFMVELTRIRVFAYLFGNSFNPEDFIFYGLGAVLAILVLWIIREN